MSGTVGRFALRFIVLAMVFYALSATAFVQELLSPYLAANARWADVILRGLGQGSHATENKLATAGFTLTILAECTAIGFVSFLAAGILAYPTSIARKAVGLAVSAGLIALLNLVRVVTLFLIGVHHPRLFNLVHEDLWSVLFIIATLALSLIWVRWAQPSRPVT